MAVRVKVEQQVGRCDGWYTLSRYTREREREKEGRIESNNEQDRLMYDQSRKASSLNLRLSASFMSLVSLRMLPILCMVGSIAILGA